MQAKKIKVKKNKFRKGLYTVLEIEFWSLKCTVVTRIRKNFDQFFIPIQAKQGDYSL